MALHRSHSLQMCQTIREQTVSVAPLVGIFVLTPFFGEENMSNNQVNPLLTR
jgi:hypothetical protein